MTEQQISLKIDAYTPKTLPMARLATYLEKLALLLGNEAHVHFSHVGAGSAECHAFVDPPAIPKIRDRANAVNDGTAPRAAMRAHQAIDDLLAEDNAIGELRFGKTKVIDFPGRRRMVHEEIGPVQRTAVVDGQIFSIGGRDETINVHLRNGNEETKCVVSVELARKLAPHLLGGKIRLIGRGIWYRTDGQWHMRNFTAGEFTVLDERSLPTTLADIRDTLSGVSADEFLAAMEGLRHE